MKNNKINEVKLMIYNETGTVRICDYRVKKNKKKVLFFN